MSSLPARESAGRQVLPRVRHLAFGARFSGLAEKRRELLVPVLFLTLDEAAA